MLPVLLPREMQRRSIRAPTLLRSADVTALPGVLTPMNSSAIAKLFFRTVVGKKEDRNFEAETRGGPSPVHAAARSVFFRNSRRSAFTLSASVVHIPCGAPG